MKQLAVALLALLPAPLAATAQPARTVLIGWWASGPMPSDFDSRDGARLGREAARRLGVQLVERRVVSVDELRRSLQPLQPRDFDAYYYTTDLMVASHGAVIIDAARAKRWPAVLHSGTLVTLGALASYGPNPYEVGRLSAKHVQRVLAGTLPKKLPVETTFGLAKLI